VVRADATRRSTPDTIADEIKTDVRQSLARAIEVNARPLTVTEWTRMLTDHGLIVDHVATAPTAGADDVRHCATSYALPGASRMKRHTRRRSYCVSMSSNTR
jgi:hypothetical protein